MSDERTTNLLENLELTRVFNAPVGLVWRAWTEPELVMRWWGPKGFTSPACKIDFRVGGEYLYCMRTPDGMELWTGGEFTEIVPHKKIVSLLFYANENGRAEPVEPNDVAVYDTVVFEDLPDGKTRLTMQRTFWDEGEDEGLAEILGKFTAVVEELARA